MINTHLLIVPYSKIIMENKVTREKIRCYRLSCPYCEKKLT